MDNDIWVLGAGQLGAMLQHAAMPLALKVNTIDINAIDAPSINDDDLITVELEHWPDTEVTRKISAHANFLNRQTLKIFADRAVQKQLLDSLALPQAKWQRLNQQTTAMQLYNLLGDQVLLKRRHGGYDGKGQLWLDSNMHHTVPTDWLAHSIAEEKVAFDEEVSLIGARNSAGECVFYPLTNNFHYQGILLACVAPTANPAPLQAQAQSMLTRLMEHLDYIGVMAMECFQVGDQLYINELAPRVHNSGHWTQAGASISQFEMHLRAVADLPMPCPSVKNKSVMINILGMEFDRSWLTITGAEIYWYGKQVRPMRKLGHINLSLADIDQTRQSLVELKPLLDDYYHPALDWCSLKCQATHQHP